MDYVSYHIEVAPDGRQVQVVVRYADGMEAGRPRGSAGLGRVDPAILALADKAAGETATRKEMQELGHGLFRALFSDPALAEDLCSRLREARARAQGLRLELDFDEARMPEVAALPWEFLRVPETPEDAEIELATDTHLVLSRRHGPWSPPLLLAATRPLRILLAVAAPNDPDLGEVVYKDVLEELQTLTRKPGEKFEPLGEPLLDANLIDLDRALSSTPDVLHLIGHGRFVSDADDPHGELAMVGAGGWTEWVRDVDFADLLARHVPAVVFLQACQGGTLSSARGLTGVASKVVQHNVPLVVAMQYPVSNTAAVSFACRFYERLAAGDPVDQAAQEGRRRLALRFTETREFATPILYLSSPNGHSFDLGQGSASSAEQVHQGLAALIELLRNPAVRTAVDTFRTAFKAADEQIAILSECKVLHDRFHELRALFTTVESEKRRLTSDPMSWDNLTRYEPDLRGVVDELVEVGKGPDVAADISWGVRKLRQAREGLRESVETFNPALLAVALNRVRRVLDREPTRVNARLVTAAGALRLDAIVKALTTVNKSLAGLVVDLEAVRQVNAAVGALSGLRGRLTALVGQHNRWQDIADELHRIDDNLNGDITELEASWPDLEEMARELYGDSTAEWATSLKKVGERIDGALDAGNPTEAKMFFRRYVSQACRRFGQVDTDLLNLCTDLRKIGDSIRLVIGAM